MIAVCLETLIQLDGEGLFTRRQPREQIVLNIMMGDQDNSWFDHALAVNPPQVYTRWEQEIRALDQKWHDQLSKRR